MRTSDTFFVLSAIDGLYFGFVVDKRHIALYPLCASCEGSKVQIWPDGKCRTRRSQILPDILPTLQIPPKRTFLFSGLHGEEPTTNSEPFPSRIRIWRPHR